LAFAVALGGIVGCARHPSQEELNRLKEVRQAATLAEKELESKQEEKASLEAQISQKRAELKELGGGGAGQFISGIRMLFCPFPAVPISAGTAWQREVELALPGPSGKKIKLRQTFRLERLDDNTASVSVSTEPAEQLEAQLMAQVAQFLGKGKFLFDVRNGLVRSHSSSVQQTVKGFAGENSQMQVVGRFSETLLEPAARTAKSAEPARN